MASVRVKFATQVSQERLDKLRKLARSEGKQIQALVDEAVEDLLEKHAQGRPRRRVMEAYSASHKPYAELYRKLS